MFQRIRDWAHARNIIADSTVAAQGLKLMEEIGETAGALARLPGARAKGDTELEAQLLAKAKDGFGDAIVVMTIMAEKEGIAIEDCIDLAYAEIKDRKGRMVNGIFIREGGEG